MALVSLLYFKSLRYVITMHEHSECTVCFYFAVVDTELEVAGYIKLLKDASRESFRFVTAGLLVACTVS